MDTLAYAKHLRAAGVPEAQAEAHAEALGAAVVEDLASREQVETLRTQVETGSKHAWRSDGRARG